jgi:hypothetical protein
MTTNDLEDARLERDEARAEVERLRAELEGEWLTRSKRLEEDGAKLLTGLAASSLARLRDVAERQREASLRSVFFKLKAGLGAGAHQRVLAEVIDAERATPLVTEVERLKASVENLEALYVSRTDNLRECEAELRDVAERQREACARWTDWTPTYTASETALKRKLADAVRATPLVTEVDQ